MSRSRAWAELLRLPALFTVPGDALSGAVAAGSRPSPRTLLAIGSSLCLYEAGMALNDWADRAEDAAERPHRPLPSGRIRPAAALTAACALTGAGLALAARAGRPALTVAAPLAATVWAYDLSLKHTPCGPAAMATARALDLLLGAAATTGRTRAALPSAALLGTHTLAVTVVSRQETKGGSPLAPLAALTATALLSRLLTHHPTGTPPHGTTATASDDVPPGAAASSRPGMAVREPAAATRRRRLGPGATSGTTRTRSSGSTAWHAPRARPADSAPRAPQARPTGTARTAQARPTGTAWGAAQAWPTAAAWRAALAWPTGTASRAAQAWSAESSWPPARALTTALAAAYAATAARPYFHATLNPSPQLTQRAVGGGIRATIPLQAALSARSGASLTALVIAGLAPLGRRFGRKVSVT
ncbi:SCO3242 family prenyltransferase [Streptomyces sp. Y7]|uniref:SCO3242 family prenyltransferase n=1 Tax=Streptomyces sp. Y7 TaxID=3342392 RepID=UPI003711F6BA